jgi:hypothetical protein
MRLAWRLLRDGRVPAAKFVLPALLVLYVISPAGPIPSILVGLAQMGQIGLFLLAVVLMSKLTPKFAPRPIVDEHLREMGFQRAAEDTVPDERAIDVKFTVHGLQQS